MGLSTEGGILSLRLMYGDDHHPTLMSSTVTLHLGVGDPRDGGVELDTVDYPGYAPLTLANDDTNFPAPDPEGDLACPTVTVCTATADWTDAPDHAWLTHDDTGIVLDVVALDTEDGEIPTADGVITVDLELFYDGVNS